MTARNVWRTLAVFLAIVAGIYFSYSRATEGDVPGWVAFVMLPCAVVLLALARKSSEEPKED
jgi:hypothetical protein